MIDSLHITNFQSHKDTSLEFHKGVNIVVGKSDSGKTSIIRALRWLFNNRPTGDAFRSNWGGETKVEIIIDNTSISRSKDKENLYEIGEVDSQNYKQLKAFGHSVPEEIETLLNLNEINLQSQHDPFFLISKSPGEVASHFNHIAHLDEIDKSTATINGWIRSLEQSIKYDTVQKKEQIEKATEYDYLEKLEIVLEVLEMEHEKMLQKIQGRRKFITHIASIKEVNEKIEKGSTLLRFEKQVDEILNLIIQLKEVDGNQYQLNNSINEIWTLEKKITDQSSLFQYEHMVTFLLSQHTALEAKEEEQSKLTELINQINTNILRIDKRKELLAQHEERFHEEMPDICPLCQHKYKKS